MALVKYGGGIVQMSGSIAGNTHARNRFGNYTRSRTKPVNPKSARQMGARIAIMYLAEQWRESPMDDAKRLAWETYADSVNWNNKLGESVKLTGFNMFIRGNAAMLRAGGSLVINGPSAGGLPPGDTELAAIANATTQKLSITFTDTFDWAKETGAYMSIEMGEPKFPTHNFFGGPWRFAEALAGVNTTGVSSPQDIDPPFTLTPGQKVWCRGRIIRKDARCSTPFGADPVIVTGALYKLNVADTLSPDMSGDYVAAGTLAEKTYYERCDGLYFIWWNDDDSSWYISPILGAAGDVGHFTKEGDPVTGAYTAVLPATGTPTITDIS